MQVKKFEAPTIQEALETIKRELGPEAIILQTKKNKKGFGLMSSSSVEVTAAVSERSLQKKKYTDTRLPEVAKEAVQKMPADRQASLYNKYMDEHLSKAVQGTRDRVEVGGSKKAGADQQDSKRLTATRYIDIEDAEEARAASKPQGRMAAPAPRTPEPKQAPAQPMGTGAVAGNLHAPQMTTEEEIRHLKRMIQEIRAAQEESPQLPTGATAGNAPGIVSNPALQNMFEQLVVNGVEKRFALSVVKKAAFDLGPEKAQSPDAVLDQVAIELMGSTEVLSALSGIHPRTTYEPHTGPKIIALVGPTGVGKTTTVAKMASEALLKRGLKVGLINLDHYKVAALDQLATYAKILNAPFRSVGSAEELGLAVGDFKNMDLILIDTTGRSQRDPESLQETQAILGALGDIQTHLVLSVTTRDAELFDMASRFSIFRPQGLIMSKLDEAMTYGALYNLPQKAKLPLVYFTTGQRVPEDIEEASSERVAALIMDL